VRAKIGNKPIGQNGRVYIVFEAGATHTGLSSAKELARVAKEAGADAIKFQMLYADRLMADRRVLFEYGYLERVGKELGLKHFREPLYEILKRRELSREEWKALKLHCDEIGITMICTATFEDEIDFLVDKLGVPAIKICSGDVDYLHLIRYAAGKNVNLQLDTGGAEIWEIEKAVRAAEEVGCRNLVIHLCPTGYPARLESINLRMIATLKSLFPEYAVAFSDHSPGWEMDVAAVALGVDLLEKTITLDRTIRSCEHAFSLEPKEAKEFVRVIREVEKALGSSRRSFPAAWREKLKVARRSPYAKKDLSVGTILRREDFEFRRPQTGLTDEEFSFVLGKALRRELKKGEVLTHEHV